MKKGFTLVELIAVVVILGIILVIAVPRITDVISTARESAYQTNERMMVNAARNYLAVNTNIVLQNNGDAFVVTLSDLQQEELIGSIIDSRNEELCDGYVIIKIENEFNYVYNAYLECGNNYYTEFYNGDTLTNVEVLVVAGGGGGGSDNGGGGGGGGVIHNTNYVVNSGQNINVTVGAGGHHSGTGNTDQGTNGGNSVFGSITALGGGFGACGESSLRPAASGGSGGGGEGESTAISKTTGGSGTINQGHKGGDGRIGPPTGLGGGGGGGAGEPGHNNSGHNGGKGGDGLLINLTGEAFYYGSGGGGGSENSTWGGGGGGARYGGGAGGNYTATTGTSVGGDGENGFGGGGGGSSSTGTRGGFGGSGVVIIRYVGEPKASGGTITSHNGFTIHTFPSGTSIFNVF